MGQVRIVSIGNVYFREYAIERGDNLSTICLRFGHRKWRPVYDHPANAPFRARFPDPDQIDFVNPVNLFIPLQGASTAGRSVRGRPVGDYIIVKVVDTNGNPVANTAFSITGPQASPTDPQSYNRIVTDADGNYTLTNPSAGNWFLVSENHWLEAPASSSSTPAPVDIADLPKSDSRIVPPMRFPLVRNAVTLVRARPAYYVICPMCGRTFLTVKPAPAAAPNSCPNDTFNLTTIEAAVDTDRTSFTSPVTGQNLSASGVKCRGAISQATVLDSVNVYWDESRFVEAGGGDYTLWGKIYSGAIRTVRIIGRRTWGAGPPITGGGRIWEFHATAQSPAFNNRSIPSNETNRLMSVLLWMTIHHTTDEAQNGFATVTALQHKAQTQGIEDDGPAADIGYQYVIDANGSIYEGRPLGIKGSHVTLFNGGNIGIALAGDFESRIQNGFTPDVLTPQARGALDDLVDVLAARFQIKSVWSHSERKKQSANSDTECPGDNVIGYVNGALRGRYPGPPR